MNVQQLLEHAHLDALGMLEPQEQADFQRELAAAPSQVREMVRREQARAGDINAILPDVTPSPELRARVLAAIATEIALGDLAGSRTLPADEAASDLYRFRPAGVVSRRWRTAAVALVGACGVLGVALANVVAINAQINRFMVVTDLPKEVMLGLGSDRINDVLFGGVARRDHFVAVPGFGGVASVLHGSGWDEAIVAFKDLPEADGSDYRLVTLDTKGGIGEEIATLGAGGEKVIRTVRVPARHLDSGSRLAIVLAPRGGPAAAGSVRLETHVS
ncbi:MAG: hypothetical protein WCK33_05090 [Phycisphaerae bacterium]|jgi:anti-sigma-K factor RskA